MKYKMKSKQVNNDEIINIPKSAICIKVINVNTEARPDEYIIHWLEPILDPARFSVVCSSNSIKEV
jgi:hypothetical protein